MHQQNRSTNYSLVPQEPRDIIKATAVACLLTAFIVIVPQLISMAMQAWS